MFSPTEYKNKLSAIIKSLTTNVDSRYINRYFHNGIDLRTRRAIFDRSFIVGTDTDAQRYIDVQILCDTLYIFPKTTKEQQKDAQNLQEARSMKEYGAMVSDLDKRENDYRKANINPRTGPIIEKLFCAATIASDAVRNKITSSDEYKKYITNIATIVGELTYKKFHLDGELPIANLNANSAFKIGPIIAGGTNVVENISTKSLVEESICNHSLVEINKELGRSAKLIGVIPASIECTDINTIRCHYYGQKD